ncbi:fimbrial protein [Scandinavium goeteborgense]|uniref:fimbrial protein n=1 Tax=Scandinavium goeteborgense TaxID=1851514 RepID=UPI000F667D95|nr:fimbrial protein [Scandinavium goeteborgense]QKN79773.1 type 1 fimbrial protein [Scandinavium goeteborgense]
MLKTLLSFSVAFSLSLSAYANPPADNWDVDGEHGEIYVTGQMTEGACQLDMGSALQEISLGDVSTQQLKNIGERSAPVTFQLRLRNCVRVHSSQTNERTDSKAWSEGQPVISVTFLAPADADNPQLVKVQGKSISGVGLRITDELHRDIQLGSRSQPIFLTPRNDTLTYYVSPERTQAPLNADAYSATVNFRLNYD